MTTDSVNESSLDLKYRPKTLDEIVGNESTVNSVRSLLEREQGPPHYFLFTGPSGCGKTTMAKIIEKYLGIHPQDSFVLDGASQRGIDNIRLLKEKAQYKPIGGGKKFYLLDECHMLTKEAQNALLLLLESPPSHAYFVLCTTNPEKLIDTIRNRGSAYSMSTLPKNKIMGLLRRVCRAEGFIKNPIPDKTLNEIAFCCQGSCRKALKILDQVIDIADDEQAFNAVKEAFIGEASTIELCKLLIKEGTGRWAELRNMIKNIEDDPESLRYAILGYLSAVLLNNPTGNDRIANMLAIFTESVMYSGKGGITLEIYLASKM